MFFYMLCDLCWDWVLDYFNMTTLEIEFFPRSGFLDVVVDVYLCRCVFFLMVVEVYLFNDFSKLFFVMTVFFIVCGFWSLCLLVYGKLVFVIDFLKCVVSRKNKELSYCVQMNSCLDTPAVLASDLWLALAFTSFLLWV